MVGGPINNPDSFAPDAPREVSRANPDPLTGPLPPGIIMDTPDYHFVAAKYNALTHANDLAMQSGVVIDLASVRRQRSR